MNTLLRLGLAAVLAVALPSVAAPRDEKRPAAYTALDEAYALYGAANLCIIEALNLQRAGRIAPARKSWQEAAAYLEKAAEKDPQGTDILRSLFACYMRLGRSAKAADTLARLSRAGLKSAAEHRELARVYQSLNRNAQATGEFEKALQRTTEGSAEWRTVARELALLYRATGVPQKAVPLFRKLVASKEADLNDRLGLAYALGEAGHHAESAEALAAILSGEAVLGAGEHVRATFFLANEYRKAGRVAEGVRTFGRLAEKHPDNPEIRQSLMHLLDAAEQREKARRLGEAFLEKHPDAHAIVLILADLYARDDHLDATSRPARSRCWPAASPRRVAPSRPFAPSKTCWPSRDCTPGYASRCAWPSRGCSRIRRRSPARSRCCGPRSIRRWATTGVSRRRTASCSTPPAAAPRRSPSWRRPSSNTPATPAPSSGCTTPSARCGSSTVPQATARRRSTCGARST